MYVHWYSQGIHTFTVLLWSYRNESFNRGKPQKIVFPLFVLLFASTTMDTPTTNDASGLISSEVWYSFYFQSACFYQRTSPENKKTYHPLFFVLDPMMTRHHHPINTAHGDMIDCGHRFRPRHLPINLLPTTSTVLYWIVWWKTNGHEANMPRRPFNFQD